MRKLLAIVCLGLLACSGEPSDGPEAEENQFQQDIAAASAKARAKLAYFWEHFAAPQVDEYDFSLKAALPRRDGQPGHEEVWLENLARSPERMVGELARDPRYLGALREGAIMTFQENQIVDWAFWRGEELLGHYTTRVLLPRLDSLDQQFLRPLLEASPDPAPP